MTDTFMIRTQEHLDNLKEMLQEEFDKGKGLAVATMVSHIAFVQSRKVYKTEMNYAPNTFDTAPKGALPKTAFSKENPDTILGIWASYAINKEEA